MRPSAYPKWFNEWITFVRVRLSIISHPDGWTEYEHPEHTAFWALKGLDPRGLKVCITGNVERDNKRWIHVSMSRHGLLPSYQDMVEVKEKFIGPNRTAYQVFPPKSQHVNFHDYCLHLWHCLDGDVTPDFRWDGMI